MSQFTPAAERAFAAASNWRPEKPDLGELDEVHLLLGLLEDSESRAGKWLAERGLRIGEVRDRWHRRRVFGEPSSKPPTSSNLNLLISQAEQRLWELPRPLQIGTEHLLLALVLDPGELGGLLREQGFQATDLEREIYALHGVTPGPVNVDEDLSPRPRSSNIDPHAPPRPLPSSHEIAATRVIDAAANRAAEGLRVIEDYVRFALDDGHLTRLCKELRHDLTQSLAFFPTGERLAARETTGDVGVNVTAPREYVRRDMFELVAANFSRVEQSLRSLEEFAKLRHPAAGQRFEQLRYRTYTLQRATHTTASSAERLAHAQLYVLIDGRPSLEEFRTLAKSLVAAGVHVLQLRDKHLDDRALLQRAKILRAVTATTATLFIMNDRPDLALLAQADGVHVGQEELSVSDVRKVVGQAMLIGVSTHNIDQARQAVLDGASYLGVGPTFPSTTKEFGEFAGLDFVRQIATEISLPAFAIGGVDCGNLSQILSAGLRRVAVSAAICRATNPPHEAAQLLAKLQRG
jgi:thiamine-phosphate pyrophosphorylase